MSDEECRLSQIQTCWREVWSAQRSGKEAAQQARWVLLERYGGAVSRYLLGAVRDPDAAQELAQEFAVAFLTGATRRVDPERGRFRDFLKGVLRNLIRTHRKRNARRPELVDELPEAVVPDEPADLDREFVACWREELLAKSWDVLAAIERQTGKPYHAVLRSRADNPEMASDELAAALGRRRNRDITGPGYRKALQRAREKFAEALLDELRTSLPSAGPDAVRDELIEPGLYEYCRPILERDDGAASDS